MDPEIMKVRDQQSAALIQDRLQSGLTVKRGVDSRTSESMHIITI